MILNIDHHTRYNYAGEVSLSVHRFFLYPRLSPDLVLRHYDLRILPSVPVQWLRDAYDNHFLQAFFPDRTNHLEIDLHLAVDCLQPNPFAFLLAPEALQFPFNYSPLESPSLSACLTPPAGISSKLQQWWSGESIPLSGPTLDTLTTWVRHFPTCFQYQRREEEGTYPPEETLARREGTCRDLATLFAVLCRTYGLATRMVTGYLYTPPEKTLPDPPGDSSFPDDPYNAASLHAWVEVYLPGAGWRGLDPTNGVFADNHYLPLSVAPDLPSTHPFQGRYFSDSPITSSVHTKLLLNVSASSL